MRTGKLSARWAGAWTLLAVGVMGSPGAGVAQDGEPGLEAVLDSVRVAWMAHDVEGLVTSSDTIRLQLPGVGRAPAVRPSQAARVLRDYLKATNEITLDLQSVRSVDENHAYAEMVRVYVVQGTSDQRVETVFLGFRRVGGRWSLREVRITP